MTTKTDNFTRANGSTLGANWQKWTFAGAGELGIVSNSAHGPGLFESGDFWTADSFGNDQYSEITIATVPISGDWVAATVRQAGQGTGYLFLWIPGTGFMLFNSSTVTTPPEIGSPVSGSLGIGDTMRISVSGTSITCSHNGTTVITATDSTYSTGSPGIAEYGTSGGISFWTGSDTLSAVVVATTALANIAQNVAVRRWLLASGGQAPYTWAVTSGTLPAGLSLASNGEIHGTPTATGASTFTVTATDANSASGFMSLTMTSVSAPFSPGSSSTDGNGVITWPITSAINMTTAESIRVLQPTSPSSAYVHALMIVLPVASGTDDTSFSDGLDTIRTLGLHNTYNTTIIEPSTGANWMADNPSNANLLQETYLLQLAAWAKSTYGTGVEKLYIVGFSRTGIAAQGLFFHHPDVYDGAGSWDFPGTMSDYDGTDANGAVGGSSSSSYGTSDNFHSNYWLSPANLALWMTGHDFTSVRRLWIGGHFSFAADVGQYDAILTGLSILHKYDNVATSSHNWHPTPDWLPSAFLALRGSQATQLFMTSGII